jgi:4-amino-4-deoxy-L-arabinose transferase-like glycosyltransferase
VKREDGSEPLDARHKAEWAILLGIAAAVTLLHLATNGRYGFHRDELQFLSEAMHLDWGTVAFPPFTPFVERIGLELFGLSMVGLRLFSVLSQAAVIVLTGLMARELGGGRLAQFTAALSIALAPISLFNGTEFQYGTFDYLWWALVALFTIRLLRTENPRWWLAIGAAIGMGLETKYTILFLTFALLCGLLFSRARRLLWSRWFAGGVAIALLIFLPNLLWQIHHDFISYHFLHFIHIRDVRWGRGDRLTFLFKQFFMCANIYAAPLWIGGLICYLRSQRYRPLAWMYLIPAAYFLFVQGVFYYLAPAYPMLIAMGAAASERWAERLSRTWRWIVKILFFQGIVITGFAIGAAIVPLADSGPLMRYALKQNDALREEIGWPELAGTVAAIRDSLPAGQRASAGVLVGNYGEQGAIEILGPAYRLPPPISLTNSAWLRGYPVPPPATLIVVGFSREEADRSFTDCRLAGHNGNSAGVKNEESQYHPDIFVCGGPRLSWPEFWKKYQTFG